jgi:2-polyprenyl-3-methyl-5-hydroxy-6-metoxy-1,4-benzoquinol methylase
MDFFDDYPQFYQTSKTGPTPNRLNKRFRAIFDTDPKIFSGATVLDISSHDGRWSFAALKTGARHVTGIEPRQHLVENSNETLSSLGFQKGADFEFLQGDVFEVMKDRRTFDVVMCLGFFYHTYRHPELMKIIHECQPKVVVVDSQVVDMPGRFCAVRADEVHREFEAFTDPSSHKGRTFVAMPTKDLLSFFFELYGFSVEFADWAAILADGKLAGVQDYSENRRATLICRRK